MRYRVAVVLEVMSADSEELEPLAVGIDTLPHIAWYFDTEREADKLVDELVAFKPK